MVKVAMAWRTASLVVGLAIAIAAFAATKPPEADAADGLFPLLDCVTYDELTDSVTARFGYSNTNATAVTVDISENYFDPPPEYRDQPVTFQPGTFHQVFDATFPAGFDGNGYLTWTLRGSSVTARNDPNIYCEDGDEPDTTPPDTAILEGPRGTVSSSTASFDLFSEGGARFDCSLDGADFTACTAPLSLNGLADGGHTVEARAIDRSGNIDPTPAARTWVVDTTAPAAPVITGPADGSADRDGSFNVRGTAEPGSVVRLYEQGVRVGTSEAEPDSGAWMIGVVDAPEGSHAFTSRATDGVGNSSAGSAAVTVRVDTMAPAVLRVAPRRGGKASRGVVATATFSEPIDAGSVSSPGTFVLRKAGSPKTVKASASYDATAKTATLDPVRRLRAGSTYRATVTAAVRDEAGNGLAAPRSWTFTVKE